MFPSSGFSQSPNEIASDSEETLMCIIQRCNTRAEYECPKCMKRYCDGHSRIHSHFDDSVKENMK